MTTEDRHRVMQALFERIKGRFGDKSPLDYDYLAEAEAIEAELAAGVADPEMHRLMAQLCREEAADND